MGRIDNKQTNEKILLKTIQKKKKKHQKGIKQYDMPVVGGRDRWWPGEGYFVEDD